MNSAGLYSSTLLYINVCYNVCLRAPPCFSRRQLAILHLRALALCSLSGFFAFRAAAGGAGWRQTRLSSLSYLHSSPISARLRHNFLSRATRAVSVSAARRPQRVLSFNGAARVFNFTVASVFRVCSVLCCASLHTTPI